MSYWVQFINTKEMEIFETPKVASSLEQLVRETGEQAKYYSDNSCFKVDKVKIFNWNKELLASYDI